MDEFDFNKLREDLLNYFGTAAAFFPNAFMDVFTVQNASNEELLKIATLNNFNLDNYKITKKY